MNNAPEITRFGLVTMQVCVPEKFTDEEVEQFANTENPTGISSKWEIVRNGNSILNGTNERVKCQERTNFVHLILVC